MVQVNQNGRNRPLGWAMFLNVSSDKLSTDLGEGVHGHTPRLDVMCTDSPFVKRGPR